MVAPLRSVVAAAVVLASLWLCVAIGMAVAQPVQLFKPDATHTNLLPCDEGLAQLAAITRPVAVVSVVGPYRSGKSFLLNQLLGRTSGFALGSTVTPVTMGVWFWADPPVLNQTALILIDTEGLYSPRVPASYDAKMFALSLIFSSTLIYNELGVLSQQSVDRFQYLTRLTLKFLDKTQDNNAAAVSSANRAIAAADARSGGRAPYAHELDHPAFWYVLEDFNLDLEPGQSPEQWLTAFLRHTGPDGTEAVPSHTLSLFGLGGGSGSGSGNAGGARTGSPMFRSVDVAMLSFPHFEPDKMKALDRIAPTDLLPAYKRQMEDLRTRLVASATPKRFGGVALGGKELSGLLRVTVSEMNRNDQFPSIVSAWDLYLQLQNSDASARALSGYSEALSSALDTQPPLSAVLLGDKHRAAARLALALYDRESVPNEASTATTRSELSGKLDARYQQAAAQHLEMVTNFCTRLTSEKLKRFDDELGAFLKVPRPSDELERVVRDASAKVQGSVVCGDLCPQSHCTRLGDELRERSRKHVAENTLAIQDACRGAKTQALLYFQVVADRELTPILDDSRIASTVSSVADAAMAYFDRLAPVSASRRSANEYRVATAEALKLATAQAADDNRSKRNTRYVLGALLPGAVLAVHVLMTLFGASLPRTLRHTYATKRWSLFLVCAFGWAFLMAYYDLRYALRANAGTLIL